MVADTDLPRPVPHRSSQGWTHENVSCLCHLGKPSPVSVSSSRATGWRHVSGRNDAARASGADDGPAPGTRTLCPERPCRLPFDQRRGWRRRPGARCRCAGDADAALRVGRPDAARRRRDDRDAGRRAWRPDRADRSGPRRHHRLRARPRCTSGVFRGRHPRRRQGDDDGRRGAAAALVWRRKPAPGLDPPGAGSPTFVLREHWRPT